jgi:hypothetical protein
MKHLTILIFALVLLLGSTYINAWTAPNSNPPNDNVAAPLNTSNAAQIKEGSLGVSNLDVAGPTLDFNWVASFGGSTLWRLRRNDGTGNFNIYLNSEGGTSPTRIVDGYAMRETYNGHQGIYRFLTAGSGGADSSIDWTEAMAINPDGSVDIDTLNVNNLNGGGGGGAAPTYFNIGSYVPALTLEDVNNNNWGGQWVTIDYPASIPTSASAVLLRSFTRVEDGQAMQTRVRDENLAETIVSTALSTGPGDSDSDTETITAPYSPDRQIEMRIVRPSGNGVDLQVPQPSTISDGFSGGEEHKGLFFVGYVQ